MNFAEILIKSVEKGLKQAVGDLPYDIESYIIGSGANFELHKYISFKNAVKLYKKYKEQLPLGKLAFKWNYGDFIVEKWHCLESNSGFTFTFLFKIKKVIEHDPNEVINEWNQLKKEREEIFK